VTRPQIDVPLPSVMARYAEEAGAAKIRSPFLKTFTLAVLAGAFTGLGAMFATTVGAGALEVWPPGMVRMLMGIAYSLGLILVVVGGAELFTCNNLMVMAWASRKVKGLALVRNWTIVYLGNFVGAVGTAMLVLISGHHTFANGDYGAMALDIAVSKTQLGFMQAVALGILCNALICLAIWLTYSARTTLDRISAIIFPVSAFVASGFEQSVGNMYFFSVALFIRTFDPGFALGTGIDLTELNLGTILASNLLPVTIGNVIGGSVLVAGVYWLVYLRVPDDA